MKVKEIRSYNFCVERDGRLCFSYSLLSRRKEIPLDSIRRVYCYINQLFIEHDDGIITINGNLENHSRLIQTLKNLPNCHFSENNSILSQESAGVFDSTLIKVAAALAIAIAVFIFSKDSVNTQPITVLVYLFPAICLIYVAQPTAELVLGTVGSGIAQARSRIQPIPERPCPSGSDQTGKALPIGEAPEPPQPADENEDPTPAMTASEPDAVSTQKIFGPNPSVASGPKVPDLHENKPLVPINLPRESHYSLRNPSRLDGLPRRISPPGARANNIPEIGPPPRSDYQGRFTRIDENPLCEGLQRLLGPSAEKPSLLLPVVAHMKYLQWSRKLIKKSISEFSLMPIPEDAQPEQTRQDQEFNADYFITVVDPGKFPCSEIHLLLGSKDCRKRCPFRGSKRYPLSPAPDSPMLETSSLVDARIKMREDLESDLKQMIKTTDGRPRAANQILVLRYPPGSGKSFILANLLRRQKILWFTTQPVETSKIFRILSGSREPQIIQSRERLCPKNRELRSSGLMAIAYPRDKYCRNCAEKKSCSFLQQFHPEKTWIMSGNFLGSPVWMKNEFKREVIIIDGNCLPGLLKNTPVEANDLVEFQRFMSENHLLADDVREIVSELLDLLTREPEDDEILVQLALRKPKIIEQARRVYASKEMMAFRQLLRRQQLRALLNWKIGALFEELARDAQHPECNSRLARSGNAIAVLNFNNLDWLRRFPIVVTDSAADELLYRRVFPHRPLKIRDLPVRREAEVIQVANAVTQKNWLQNKWNLRRVAEYISRRSAGKVGIICHPADEERLSQQFPQAVFGHYGNIRGALDFESCDTLFLIGRAEPEFRESLQQARAIFSDESKISCRANPGPRNFGMTFNNQTVGNIYEFEDERLGAVVAAHEAEEMRQAAYLIRPLTGKHKKIFVLAQTPIPGLPPDRLDALGEFYRFNKTTQPSGIPKTEPARAALSGPARNHPAQIQRQTE